MNRITVVDTVYHQSGNLPPTSANNRYGFQLETDELPYGRPPKVVGEKWVAVDLGWFGEGGSGLISISNLGGEKTGKNPTPEEKAAEDDRVLEVSLAGGAPGDSAVWLVRPGHHFRGWPSDPNALRVRCRKGTTRYSVMIYPK